MVVSFAACGAKLATTTMGERRRRQEVLNSYEGFLLYVLSNVNVGPIVRRNHIFGVVNYTNHSWLT